MNNPPEEGRRTYRPKRCTFTTNMEVVSKKNSSLISSPPQDYRKHIYPVVTKYHFTPDCYLDLFTPGTIIKTGLITGDTVYVYFRVNSSLLCRGVKGAKLCSLNNAK